MLIIPDKLSSTLNGYNYSNCGLVTNTNSLTAEWNAVYCVSPDI